MTVGEAMIHKKTNIVAQLTADAINQTGDLIQAKVKDLTQYNSIANALFCKTVTTFYATWILCKNGYGQDAIVLVRTMMENTVTLAYINSDPKTLIPLYANHFWVKQSQRLKDYNKLYPHKPYENQRSEYIEKNYNKVKDNYPKRTSHWSGKTMLDMTIACGLEDYYYMVYRLGSDYAHSGSDSLGDYISKHDSVYDFRLGARSSDKTDLSMISACSWALISIEQVCRAFCLEPPECCQIVLDAINNVTSESEVEV